MKEKKDTVTIKVKDAPEEPTASDEKKPAEKKKKPKEKPLEKMSKAELLEKIKEIKEDSAKNYDLYMRTQAEMENLKKRSLKEKSDWIKYSNETLIKDILPVMDNLEKAISHSNNENSIHALREGVELTLKGLRDTLAKSGLEKVKAQSEPFDPCYHQAVSEQEDEGVKAGIILHELQKGYTLNQRLIRPAMVVISKGDPDNIADGDKPPENTCEE